ncbi:hypothetical protein APHAL10511_005412 [Amanita phalloides]|nr:hypothetical protein APHAL10511_005412 [Amanita phalloides]
MMNDRENIVVVGAGSAGSSIARQLSKTLNPTKHNLILISPRNYMIHYPSVIRTLVHTVFDEEHVFIPLENLFEHGRGTLMVNKVVSIQDEGPHGGYVTLEDGTNVDWSVLVLAPGSIWEGPFAFPDPRDECLDHLLKWKRKLQGAKHVVIAGAGAVGVELATELKHRFPDKNVTIVHGQELPMNDYYPDKWRRVLDRRIRKQGIKLIINDYIDDLEVENGAVKTRQGQSLVADLVIPCRGGKVNTDFITTLGDNVLWSSSKCVRIDPAFRLFRHKRIFAAGDVIEWEEQKQLIKALNHAEMVAKNVISVARREDPRMIYKGSAEVISLSMGKGRGATYLSYLWGMEFGDMFTRSWKNKHLVPDGARQRVNVKS